MFETKNENTIINIIKYGAIIPIILLSVAITYFLIVEKNHQLENEIKKIKQSYLAKNKEKAKTEVENTYKAIKYEIDTSLKELKNIIKNKVYEAHNVATKIYEKETKFKDHSQEQILNLIKYALSGMIYNEGRGYIFMNDSQGKVILQPFNEELEGQNFINYKDIEGNQFVQNIVSTIKNKSEMFDVYYWYKTKNDPKVYKKISFYKYFEPFNISIGTGEYYEDYINNLKKRILRILNNKEYTKNNYIFIFDKDGKYLVHYDKKKLNTNGFLVKDKNNKNFIKDMYDETKKNKENFVSYIASGHPFGNLTSNKKISYVKYLDDWGWAIGSGFYLEELDNIIKEKEKELVTANNKIINKIMIFSLLITIVLIIVSFLVSKIIEAKFKAYKDEITNEAKNRLKQEKIFFHQNKMASMGEMLLNIAHQWRQPLSIISTSATGVKLQKEINCLEDKDLIHAMDNINNSSQYLSQTIEDFRNFLMPSDEKQIINLKDIISKTITLVSPSFKSNNISIIENNKDIAINTLENELIQVLMNLIKNAKDILIEKNIEEKLIFINTYKKDNFAYIEIIDNAQGIDENIIDSIFEPYFTTKHKTKGTGIGLYMSLSIVNKKLDGEIYVSNKEYSHENKNYIGAIFTIKIPL